MNRRIASTLVCLLLIAAFLAAGCQAEPPESASQEASQGGGTPAVIAQSEEGITVEGRVVPSEFVELAFSLPGQVAEILVEEGDSVKAGDVLARLGNTAGAKSAVATAELEVLSASKALKDLTDHHEDNLNAARQALNAARQAAREADRRLEKLSDEALQTEIDQAYGQMIEAEDDLENARNNFEEYEDEPEDDFYRARAQRRLGQAQEAYDEAVRLYEDLAGSGYEFTLTQAETEQEIAQAQLESAQENYDTLLAGPDPDALEQAQSRLDTAEAALAGAQESLAQLELRAPSDGRVAASSLKLGATVAAGQPVLTLADFSSWWVETEDLTEIDVVEVSAGQPVTVVPDALPDLELSGQVESVGDSFEEKLGDITYTARISLEETDPRLRWGMTVLVTFERP